MLKTLGAIALLASATALQAGVFSFSYSGGSVAASGTITAKAAGSGLYTVTGISGTRNGATISYAPTGGGTFYYGGSTGTSFLNAGGIAFSLSGLIGLDAVTYAAGIYTETIAGVTTPGFKPVASITRLQSFSITAVPEPSTLMLLCSMGLGIGFLARKFPRRKSPPQA